MTKEELDKLKEELKQEIMSELACTVTTNNWSKVRKAMNPRLKQFENPHISRIEGALATLTRYTFDVRTVVKLPDDKLVDTKNFVLEIVDLMLKYSPSGLSGKKHEEY